MNKYEKILNGQSFGDSMLLPYEFMSKKLAHKRWNKLGFKQSLFFGYGITSDDSDHSILTYQALINSQNDIQFEKELKKNLKWWLFSFPVGIGKTTLKSILKIWIGLNKTSIDSAGNGPLMRVPIIAIHLPYNLEKRNKYIKISTQLTHHQPEAIMISKAIGNFIAYIYKYGKLPDILENLDDIFLANENETWKNSLKKITKNLLFEDFLKEIGCEKFVSGYILHTALVSLYIIYYQKSLEECFNMIIEASGDTDTLGALVGAYLSLIFNNDAVLSKQDKIILPPLIHDSTFKTWVKIFIKNVLLIPIVYFHVFMRFFKIY